MKAVEYTFVCMGMLETVAGKLPPLLSTLLSKAGVFTELRAC